MAFHHEIVLEWAKITFSLAYDIDMLFCDCPECELMPIEVTPVIFVEGYVPGYGWQSAFTQAYLDHVVNNETHPDRLTANPRERRPQTRRRRYYK